MIGTFSRLWGVVVGISLAVGCSSGPGTIEPDGGVFFYPIGAETVAPASVRAGEPLGVTCMLVDELGELHPPLEGMVESIRRVPEESVELDASGEWIATRAGHVEVVCSFPELGLVDETPSLIEVTPGPAARTVAHAIPDSIIAGETLEGMCEVYDAWGNAITDASPTFRAEPAGTEPFAGSTGLFVRAGRYELACDVAGAEAVTSPFEVVAGMPAAIVLSRVPDKAVYASGEVVEVAYIVLDRFGNEVSGVVVDFSSEPVGEAIGVARFRYADNGRYVVTATVQGPTEAGAVVTSSVDILVDDKGPAIDCTNPMNGGIVNAPPGALMFSGTVADPTGVAALWVNGVEVPVAHDGTFSAPLDGVFGINFVDVAAVDGVGMETSQTCSFLLSNTWAPDDRRTNDLLSLRLAQAAIDDGNRAGAVGSFGDILDKVLNSPSLRNQLHASMIANPVLAPNKCYQDTWLGCALSASVTYVDSRINGPNTVALTLVDGGMRANVVLRGVGIRVRVRGKVLGISYDTTGWVTISSVTLGFIIDLSLAGERLNAGIRPGSATASAGSISTSFSGLDGALINIVVDLFNGQLRDMIARQLRDYVTTGFDSTLDSVFGGLDVSGVASAFDVDKLDGSGAIRVEFGAGLSSVSTTPARLLLGMGTRMWSAPAHARPTFGAPIPPGVVTAPALSDPSGVGSVALSIHVALLNQALHALWRGGFFDTAIGDAATGSTVTLSTGLPPVAQVRADGRIELTLGAADILMDEPGLFPEPLAANLGMRISMLAGTATAADGTEQLAFSDLRVDELHFSTDTVSLDRATRETLEGFLQGLFGDMLLSSLGSALPALPIPRFALDSSLATYGLPAGGSLGLGSASFSTPGQHFVLGGNFEIR